MGDIISLHSHVWRNYAFNDFSSKLGFMNSPWVGLKHFDAFFGRDFLRIMRNTLLVSAGTLIVGFPAPIIFALLVTSIRNKFYRKITTLQIADVPAPYLIRPRGYLLARSTIRGRSSSPAVSEEPLLT